MRELTNLQDAQRIDARMTPPASDTVWPLLRGEAPPSRAACTANACSSGRKPCPCPDACRVPDNSVIGRVVGVLDRVPVRHFWLGYIAFYAAVIAAGFLVFAS